MAGAARPHKLAVKLTLDPAEPEVVRVGASNVCHDTALFCDRAGFDRKSLELDQVALACRTEVFGPRAERTLATKHNMAFVLSKLGRLAEAADAYREVLAAEVAARGEEHEETLLTRIGLAELLRKSGDLRAAETEFRAITRILDASPSSGNRQPYLALALTLHERGRLTEAEAILRDELARGRHELGDRHQHTIMLMRALADLLLELGKVAEAAPLITTAMAASTALVGSDHEETLVLRTRVAAALADNGDMAGAEAEFRDILAIVEKTKGEDHPMALDARRILATTLENVGNVVEAEAQYRRLFEVESRFRTGRRRMADPVRPLANIQIKRGHHETAERALREILVERTRSGATGSTGITVRLRLATCLALRGDLHGAEAECRTALNAARTSLGPDHPETTQASTQLAELLVRGTATRRAARS